LEPKSKKYGLLIIAIILLIGLSVVAYSHLLETKVESQQALIQEDSDASEEALASVSKSTVILIVCVGLAGLLGLRRKKLK
jgi:flagellar basal body-associated protein FliL